MLYVLLVALLIIALIAIVPAIRSRRRRSAARNQTVPESTPVAEVEAAIATGPERDVRFTVFRPGAVTPKKWYTLLVFMHEAEAPQDTLPEDLPAEEQVRREAARILGEESHGYVSATEDSAQPVPLAGQLLFAVELPGFEVNPPAQHIAWLEAIQNVHFRIRAGEDLTGTTARGRLSIYRGPLLLAEMTLVVRVGADEAEPVREHVKSYRKVFASYSRLDEPIVRQVEAVASAIGDTWLRDVHSLRSGEQWNPALARLIEEADVFQLFWSWNALESDMVRREWLHAIGLNRSNFIRPVYWEDPFPRRPERDLPPAELSAIEFSRLPSVVVPAAKAVDAPMPRTQMRGAAAPAAPQPAAATPLPAPAPAADARSAGAPPPRRGIRFGPMLATAAIALLAVSGVLKLGFSPATSSDPAIVTAPPSDVNPDPVVEPPPPPPPPPPVQGRGTGQGRGGRGGQTPPQPTPMPDASSADRALRSVTSALATRQRSVVVLFPFAERADWTERLSSTDVLRLNATAGRIAPLTADPARATAPYTIVVERTTGGRTIVERYSYIAHLRRADGEWTIDRLEPVPR